MIVAIAVTAYLAVAPPAALPPSSTPSSSEPREETHLSEGGPTEAPTKLQGVAYYEDLAKKTPSDPEAHEQLAAAYARNGKTDDARREARRAIELAPGEAGPYEALGLIEEGVGNLPVAEENLKKAAALDGSVGLRLDVARVLFLQSKLPEANDAYAKIAKDFDKNGDVQFAVADAYKEIGRYEDASALYDHALELAEPGTDKRIDILIEQARMVADRGNNIQAMELLKRAQGEAPKSADVQ
ncbi:MAG TPA: tetratricopeptide repeat protein, partial [Myxococcota bacterium]